VLPRAPPLVEGMAALVLADAALIQRARAGPDRPLPVLPPLPTPHAVSAPDGGDASTAGKKRGHAAAAEAYAAEDAAGKVRRMATDEVDA
jgi:hypothetical protein